ncbi:MAG: helix-turn-helix domain-containing protein [bacterium]|nr:helix-turn-helix domain-containing protein [bacterium]
MIVKEELQNLYAQGFSLKEISRIIKVSENQVAYWMKKFNLKRRSRSEALYIKNNPEGDPFLFKKPLTKHDFVLLGIGLGLWWGEGSKTYPTVVRLGNTNPDLISSFILFLTEICGFPRDRLRFGLQIFSDMSPKDVLKFWMQTLDVSQKQFYKIIVTPARSLGTYRHKTKYGVLTIYAGNRNLRRLLDHLMEKYADVAQLVERIHGGS